MDNEKPQLSKRDNEYSVTISKIDSKNPQIEISSLSGQNVQFGSIKYYFLEQNTKFCLEFQQPISLVHCSTDGQDVIDSIQVLNSNKSIRFSLEQIPQVIKLTLQICSQPENTPKFSKDTPNSSTNRKTITFTNFSNLANQNAAFHISENQIGVYNYKNVVKLLQAAIAKRETEKGKKPKKSKTILFFELSSNKVGKIIQDKEFSRNSPTNFFVVRNSLYIRCVVQTADGFEHPYLYYYDAATQFSKIFQSFSKMRFLENMNFVVKLFYPTKKYIILHPQDASTLNGLIKSILPSYLNQNSEENLYLYIKCIQK